MERERGAPGARLTAGQRDDLISLQIKQDHAGVLHNVHKVRDPGVQPSEFVLHTESSGLVDQSEESSEDGGMHKGKTVADGSDSEDEYVSVLSKFSLEK